MKTFAVVSAKMQLAFYVSSRLGVYRIDLVLGNFDHHNRCTNFVHKNRESMKDLEYVYIAADEQYYLEY